MKPHDRLGHGNRVETIGPDPKFGKSVAIRAEDGYVAVEWDDGLVTVVPPEIIRSIQPPSVEWIAEEFGRKCLELENEITEIEQDLRESPGDYPGTEKVLATKRVRLDTLRKMSEHLDLERAKL